MAKRSPAAAKKIPVETGARLPALAILFFLSGAIALVYEVVWQRQFALLLGSAATATAAVLGAYFAGLGAGSLIVGRLAERWPNPLRAYAILELLIAAGAVLATAAQPAFEALYPWLYERLAETPSLFFAGKLSIAFLSIAIPTFCMGGTLPVLGRFVDQGQHHLGITVGRLYVANTAGAAAGALCVPFVLLPALGINGTFIVCVTGNLALAGWAWRWSSRAGASESPECSRPARKPEPGPNSAPVNLLLLFALASGVATFALQVFWNRAFAQIHENSVHSFAIIVTTVILALAAGAQFARIGLRRALPPNRLLAFGWGIAGVLIACGPWLFLRLTGDLGFVSTSDSWLINASKLAGLAAIVLFLPMTFLGVGLPAMFESAGLVSRSGTSALLGRLLSVNIAGSVAGALIAGFAAPQLGHLWQWIVVVGLLMGLLGGVARFQLQVIRRPVRSIATALTGAALGVACISQLDLPRVRVDSRNGERLLHLAEGAHGITAVTERSGSRRLKLNNHYLLGGTASTGDERLQAHLPLLLHPAPRNVAFLGVGTGITTGGARFHPVESITAIELVPEVITAAREFFPIANANVLTDERTRVVTEDARNFLRGSRELFDVIVGDLVVPWRQGEGALFTVESFAAARESLAANGLFCQWVPCFQLTEEEVRIVIHTFLTVFDQALVLRGDFSPTEPALGLIGWKDTPPEASGVVTRNLSLMSPDPANPHLVDPDIFWMHRLGVLRSEDAAGWKVAINSDNRPVIELLGPIRPQHERAELLVGRRLQSFLAASFPAPESDGSSTAEAQRLARQAADLFAEMLLRVAEGKGAQARDSQAALKALLPEATYQLLFP